MQDRAISANLILIIGCVRLGTDALTLALQSFGFDVISAPSARDVQADLPLDILLLGAVGPLAQIIASIQACRGRFPDTPVVVIGADRPESEVVALIESGARAYEPANTPLEELVRTINAVSVGEVPSGERLAFLVASRIAAISRQQRSDQILRALTAREQEVLPLLRAGLSNKEIGQQLSISANTVKIHVHRILEKLAIRGRGDTRRLTAGGILSG